MYPLKFSRNINKKTLSYNENEMKNSIIDNNKSVSHKKLDLIFDIKNERISNSINDD